jgi:hypothetical protein
MIHHYRIWSLIDIVAGDSVSRILFIESVVNYIRKFGLDGVDLGTCNRVQ